MRPSSFLAPLLFAATAWAQAVEEGIEPAEPAPDGCETTVDDHFTIGVLNDFRGRRRDIVTAQQAADGALHCTLKDGILHDQYGRTGSIVANRQFQFDGPPQAGAIYTGGFSVCKNGSLAIGGTTRWWRCMSGEFGNLYDESIGGQCHEIRILAGFADKPTSSKTMPIPTTIPKSESDAKSTPSDSSTESAKPTGSSGASTTTHGSSSPTASPSGSARSSSGSPVVAAAPPAQTGDATINVLSGLICTTTMMAIVLAFWMS